MSNWRECFCIVVCCRLHVLFRAGLLFLRLLALISVSKTRGDDNNSEPTVGWWEHPVPCLRYLFTFLNCCRLSSRTRTHLCVENIIKKTLLYKRPKWSIIGLYTDNAYDHSYSTDHFLTDVRYTACLSVIYPHRLQNSVIFRSFIMHTV